MGREIERKFLVRRLPERLEQYQCLQLEQAYLCTEPVIRIRRQEEDYILTCKGSGLKSREECNLPMSRSAYDKLMAKAEGLVIRKRRYLIPLPGGLKVELDCFEGEHFPLKIAEVEFPDEERSGAFVPLEWFGREVTMDGRYQNSWLSQHRAEA